MTKKEMDEIFKKRKRAEAEPATLTVKRFTVDDSPVCMAWYGLGSHPRMACEYLGVGMGDKHFCFLTGREIFPGEDDALRPVNGCPLWK